MSVPWAWSDRLFNAEEGTKSCWSKLSLKVTPKWHWNADSNSIKRTLRSDQRNGKYFWNLLTFEKNLEKYIRTSNFRNTLPRENTGNWAGTSFGNSYRKIHKRPKIGLKVDFWIIERANFDINQWSFWKWYNNDWFVYYTIHN